MALFHRLRRLVAANVHELVDQMEDPAALLKQSLRDTDRQLRSTLDAAVRVTADEKLLARQLAEQDRRIDACTEHARNAIARSDDDAARDALRERAEHRHVRDALAAENGAVREAAQQLRVHLAHLRSRRREAQARLTGLLARQQAAMASHRALQELSGLNEESALSEFNRLAAKVQRSEDELRARTELQPATITEPPLFDAEIEDELAALKAECEAGRAS